MPTAKLEQLAQELRSAPRESGYAEAEWSGSLLSRHLRQRYGIRVVPRHCRRVIARMRDERPRKAEEHRRERLHLGRRTESSRAERSPRPLGVASDLRNKSIALKRIQRLCSTRIPMATMAMTLFDLVGDAIQQGDIRIMTTDFEHHRWLTNTDISSWGGTFGRLLALPPKMRGITMDPRILGRKELWRHEELEVGSFERSAAYNEFARHIGFHHTLSIMLHDAQGRLGNYPIWRSRDMRPFSVEDRQFAAAIRPHLNHAIAVAGLPSDETTASEENFSPLDKYQLGIVSIDMRGRILAINRAARAIFDSLRVNDYAREDSIKSGEISDSFKYIAGVLRRIFCGPGEAQTETRAPVVRLMNHPSGYQVRLRGYAAEGESSKAFFVTIEAGETLDRSVKRISYRYGVNQTQAELIAMLGREAGLRPRELATRLGIRPDTLNKSLRRLADRLELDSHEELRRFSHTIMSNSSIATSLPPPGQTSSPG